MFSQMIFYINMIHLVMYFTCNVYVMYFIKAGGDGKERRTEKRGKLQNQVKREKSSGHHRPSGSTSRQA